MKAVATYCKQLKQLTHSSSSVEELLIVVQYENNDTPLLEIVS